MKNNVGNWSCDSRKRCRRQLARKLGLALRVGDAIGKGGTERVGAGVTASDVDLIRNVDDLILTLRDSGERVTVAGYFTNDGGSASSLEAIEFADGFLQYAVAASNHKWRIAA